jgi:hypothetical protein
VSGGAPAPLWFGQAPEYQRETPIQPPVTLQVTVGGRAVRVAIHGATQPAALVGGLPATLVLLMSTTRSNGNGRDLLRGWIDHVVLCAAGHAAPDGRRVLIVRPDQKPEESRLGPLSVEVARGYLATLAADLLAGVYPRFLPCEAVLGWVKKEPRPALTDYILMLREDDWTKFTSEWGPVPDARSYDPPSEEEALAIVARRFQPLFDAQPPGEGARAKRGRR